MRRLSTSFVAIATAHLVACGGAHAPKPDTEFPDIAATPGQAEYAFERDGLARSFIVYVPPDHVVGRPLAVVLHGGGGSAKQMFAQHPLEQAADQRGYVIVAAQGTPLPDDATSYEWNGQVSLDSGIDDSGYLEEVILGVATDLGIDPARRYVAGFSGGASMAVRFGAEKSAHVAAIATFAGKVGLSQAGGPFVFPPEPTTPISVQMTYGTEDPNLDGEAKGDVQATSAQAGIDWWVDALGCARPPQTEVVDPITRDTYAGCRGGAVVRLNVVQDMPHTWPEKPADAVAGTKLVLDFFADKIKS